MGVIQVPGERSGQLYSIQIDGDVPTNTEYARIADYVKQQEDAFAQRYEQSFGKVLEEDDGTAIGRGFERGKKQIKQAFGETLGTIGEQAGLGFLAEYGQGVEERARQELGELQIQQPERMQSTDVTGLGSALTYAGEVVGEQIPQLGLGLGAAIAAPVVVPATTALGSFAVGATAAAGVTAPILFGNNIQRQEDEVAAGKKSEVDVGAALTATFGQAALEGISDKILLGSVFRPLGKSIFTRTVSRAGGGATTESLTEVGQQMMERAQAGLPIDSEDAIAEYREAAIAGGLIGGGTRATLGAVGERDPEITETTETGGTAPGPEGQVVQDTQTTPPVEPEQLELDLGDPLLRPQLREGQEQGELFTAASEFNPALKKEAENAADPTSPKGKAEQTDEQRAAESAVVAAEAATPSTAVVKEEDNLANEQVRKQEKANAKAVAKTQEYLPGLEPQESGTAAIESEQTGEQIEVGKKRTRTKDVLTDNNIANLDAFDQTIDDDFLANLNVPKQALIRRESTKKSLIGKKVSDEGVLDELRNYARISSVPEAKEGVQGFLDGLEVEDAGVRPESEGVGTGVPSGRLGVGRGEGGVSGVDDTTEPTTPDARTVGAGVLDTDAVDSTTGVQPDTLTKIDDATAIQVQQWLRSTDPFTGSPPTISDLQQSNAEKSAVEKVKRAAAAYDQKYSIGPTTPGPQHRRTPSERWNGMDVLEAQKEAQESNDPAMLKALQDLDAAQIELLKIQERDSRPREDAKRALKDMFPEYAQQIDEDVYGFVKQATETNIDRIEPAFVPEQSDTLTPDEQGIAAVQQLAEQATATPVDLTDAQVQYIRENPLSPEAQTEAEKRRIIRETPGGYEAMVRNALQETGTRTPAEVLVEPEELARRQARLAEGQPKGLEVPTGPREGAIGGRETATDANFVSVPEAVRVPDAPEVQGASVSQEQLQAMEAQQDAAAQARIDKIFESNRGKQPQVREYHDTQVDPRSAPEVTTAVDKEAIAELLETSDDNLKGDANASARAAKLFFKRFRRPVDALAEIGAIRVDGPTQSIELDFVKDFNLGKDGKPIKTKKDLTSEDMTADFAFYKGMTQGNAIQASLWVNNNLSRQARNEVRDAKIAARIDPNDNRSDAYLGVVKAAKAVVASDARKVRRKLSAQAKGTAETARKSEVQKQLSKQTEVPAIMAAAPKPIRLRSGQEVYRVTTPQKGLSTIEANLVRKGFKRRKVRKNETVPEDAYTLLDEKDGAEILYVYQDTRNKNELLTKEYHKEIVEDLEYTLETYDMLLIDPVKGLDQKLLPSIQNALQRGDLQFAIDAIATTSRVKRIREIAAKLGNVVGSTQIQVVDDLSPLAGRRAAGLFSPEENTIYIDANNGMNVHTILHEMTHAATSASIAANPSLPEVKQLQTLFNAVREQFGEVYGTANLDEFVAEAFSNPEFQSALALTRVDGGKMSGWEKFTGAIKRVVRKILGLSPSPTALSEVDRLVEGVLSPAPATRAAPNMLMAAGSPEGSAQLGQSIMTAAPASKKDQYIQMAGDVLSNTTDPTMQGAKNVLLGSLDSRMLTDVAKSRFGISFAPQLNVLIRQMSGAMRNRSDVLESMLNDYRGWARKNKEAAAVLNNLIPRSTFLRVDPSVPKSFYSSWKVAYNDLTAKKSIVKEFNSEKEQQAWIKNFNANRDEAKFTTAKKMPDPDPDTIKQWTELNNQYKSLGKDGQAYYRQIRNFFQDTYDEIVPALRSRLEATISDKKVRATAFEKLQDILMKESGLIRPYFPLMRKGKHRLQYTALDENGQPEVYVEYYQNRRELERAFKVAERLSASGTKPEYSRADRPMNFNSVPSSSFVYDILQTMEASKGSFKDPEQYQEAVQSIVDLALDAMPERSFMQGFRRRGDKDNPLGYRGFIGDTTPTGAGGVEFDVATMLKEKGRDLNRQIVQIQASAEIEKFRNQLRDGGYLTNPETADIARYIDRVASFAQKPNVPRWSQTLNALGFNMTMGLNFSSAAITFFDVGMSAMPVISAEYGIKNTAKAYKTAASLLARAPKTRTILVTGSDGQPVEQEVRMGIAGKSAANYVLEQLPEPMKNLGLGRALKRGMDQGQFNQSLTQESLEVSRDAPLEGINRWTSAMFHHSERFNRETTFIAAYILEAQKILSSKGQLTDADIDAAAQKAIETTEFTLGSTAAAGRPVWAQSGVGNVLFLFKRFAIAKYYMMYKLGHESIGTTNTSKIMQELGVTEAEAQEIAAQRKIARAGLRNFLASTGIMAGLGGMPMMGAFGVIYNMFADEDEDDFEAATRKLVGEGIYGGLANEILGVDVANRISMNSLLYRAPIIEKDQSPLWTLIEQLGGPVIGVTNSILRGAPEIYNGLVEGDMSTAKRGVEAVSPSALRNAFKGWRFYTEGATTRRGDPITEDINVYNSTMQALGFAPQAYIQQLEFNKNARRRNEAVNSKRTKLLRRRNMAMREGDYEELQNVDALIEKFNAELPQGAEKSRITSETKQRSFRSFGKTTSKMRGGMTYTPFMEEILEEYDKGFQLF